MRKQIALAALWGAAATWIFWWLFAPLSGLVLRLSEPAVRAALQNGWSGEQIRPSLLALSYVVRALFYGFVFGLPLGLLSSSRRAISWLTFVVAFLATLVAHMLAVGEVLTHLAHPVIWLTALGTLLFVILGSRLRSSHVRHRAA